MQITRLGTDRTSSVVVSGILNCVCPECGGRMGGAGKEFKCQGECLTDWRRAWEQSLGRRIRHTVRGRSR